MQKLFLLLFFSFQTLAIGDFGGELEFSSIQSSEPFILLIENNDKSKILIVKNLGSDTFAEILINNKKTYSASWMGNHGYYIIYLPQSKSVYKINISSLNSTNLESQIGFKIYPLKSISTNIIIAFQSHSNASNIRYQQYVGGPDKKKEARKLFNTAKKIFIDNGLYFFAALSSYEEAVTLTELNKHSDSIHAFNTAIKYWDTPIFQTQKLKSMNMKGLSLWKTSKLIKALTIFNHLIDEYKPLNKNDLTAMTLNNIGLIHWDKGDITLARDYYIQSLKIKDFDLNNKSNNPISKPIAATLNNLALTFDSLGEPKKAEILWELQLEKYSSFTNKNSIAKAKKNLATLYLNKGNYRQAKDIVESAITVFEKSNNKKWLSLSYYDLGLIYEKLGLIKLAEIQFIKSLSFINKKENPKDIIKPQMKLIELYTHQKNYIESGILSKETFEIAHQIKNNKILASLFLNDFKIALNNNNFIQAEIAIDKSITISKDRVPKRFISNLYVNKAKLMILMNKLKPAINLLENEIIQLKRLWDTKQLNTANILLTKAYIKSQNLSKAKSTINSEIDNIRFYMNLTKSDKIKSDLSRMLKETLGIYNTITALQHKPELGFVKTNQMLADYRTLKKKDKTLQSSLSEASVDDLLTIINNKTLALENNKLSDEDKKHIQNDIIELKAELDFSFTAAINNNTEEFDLKEIQTKLDDNSLVIQFSISDAGGVAWWISQDKFHSFILEDKESIAKLVTKARATFMQENNNYQAISDLSDKLFSPLKSFNGIKKIFLILDEPLNLIPFNALKDPRFNSNISIAENTSIQRISSIKSVFKLDRKHGKYKSIIIADPITSQTDVRLSHIDIIDSNTISFNRLLGTKSEALNISKIIDAKILQGFEANKSHFMNLNFSNFNIIHFATHAFFHQDIPGLSSLVLSNFNNKGEQQPSFLRGLEISNLNLNGKLIVLSGCETGVGNHDNSLGLDGLTQSFMQAGAKNLIASLWKVDDRITEKMMVEFYKNYSQGMSIANALRKAQSKIRNNPRTRHPKYWAGWFLLSN